MKLFQGLGTAPDTIKNWAFGALVPFYFERVLGVPAALCGLALAIALWAGAAICAGALDLLAIPRTAALEEVDRGTITRLGAFVGLVLPALYLIPLWILSRDPLTREVHAQIRARLDARHRSLHISCQVQTRCSRFLRAGTSSRSPAASALLAQEEAPDARSRGGLRGSGAGPRAQAPAVAGPASTCSNGRPGVGMGGPRCPRQQICA